MAAISLSSVAAYDKEGNKAAYDEESPSWKAGGGISNATRQDKTLSIFNVVSCFHLPNSRKEIFPPDLHNV